MLRRVVWQNFNDVSHVFAASIIRAIAGSTFEPSVNFYQTTRCNFPGEIIFIQYFSSLPMRSPELTQPLIEWVGLSVSFLAGKYAT
jgi:hypothetical protein